MKRLLPIALLLLALTPSAQADDMKLTVKPLLCITDNRNPVCEMSFLVVWETGERGYYCLFNDYGEAPVRCWNEERNGEASDERTVQESFRFWMTSTDATARLAEVSVEVLRLDSDDRRRKRRPRHVWDIN